MNHVSPIRAVFAATFGLLLFVSLGALVEPGPMGIDPEVLKEFERARTPFWNQVMLGITAAGEGRVTAALTTIVVVVLLATRHGKEALFMAVANIGTGFLSPALKDWFARPRPELVSKLAFPGSLSFPSGHAMSAMVFYTAFALVVHHVAPRWSAPAAALAAFMIPVMGFTRMYLGVHYPSDVVAGWAVGAAWVWLAYLGYVFFLPALSRLFHEYEKSR